MMLPLPFARVVCVFGEPLRVPADATGEALEAQRVRLDAELDALTRAADAAVGIRE